MDLSLTNRFGLCRVYVYTKSMELKILSFPLYRCPLSDQALQSRSCLPDLSISCYNGRSVTRTALSLMITKYNPHIFYFRLRLVLSCKNVHLDDFVWLVLLVFILLLYNRIHAEGWKPCANREPVSTLENFQWREISCLASDATLRDKCQPLIHRRGKHKL
jgi:hypothetical protein